MVIISVDMDGVLDYPDNVQMVNQLYAVRDHFIMVWTARGEIFRDRTEAELKEYGVNYHLLVMGKLKADYYIDDKNVELDVLYEKIVKEGKILPTSDPRPTIEIKRRKRDWERVKNGERRGGVTIRKIEPENLV